MYILNKFYFFKEKPITQVDTTARLAALRSQFSRDNINAYIIPSEDAHQVSAIRGYLLI